MIKRDIGGSLSGHKFSSIHGDLITELLNGETKRQTGPYRSGFSTNVNTVNTWIKNPHILAKLRKKFNDTIRLTTDSHHKETTQSEMKRHSQHVKNLKDQLKKCNTDPFSDGPAKQLTTGKIIDAKIIPCLLDAEKIGNSKYLEFLAERLVKGTKKFFDPVRKTTLDAGIKRKPRANKAFAIKEDRQVFGIALSGIIDLEEPLQYPLTIFPLSFATPEGNLRQRNNKALLKNFLITEANAIAENSELIRSRWIVDGIALIRPMKTCRTYDLYFESFVKSISSPKVLEPIHMEIANDIYKYESCKGNTKTKRGIEQQRTVLTSASQNILQPYAWKSFSNNIDNKTNLINLLVAYLRSDSFYNQIRIPVIVNVEKNT